MMYNKEPLIQKLNSIIHLVVRVLAIFMVFVIVMGVIDVGWTLYQKVMSQPTYILTISDILATFGAFMAVLIAIEIFINIIVYLQDDVIHVKIVMATALMAIARKVIILDLKKTDAEYLGGIAAVVLSISIGYWLVARFPRFNLKMGMGELIQAQAASQTKELQSSTTKTETIKQINKDINLFFSRLNKPWRWYHLHQEEVIKMLETDADKGLNHTKIEERQQNFGDNLLTQRKGQGALLRFLLQFNQILVYILLVAMMIKLFLGDWLDAAVIFGVVLLNSIIGFIQEGKALNALQTLSRTLTTESTVLRNGEEQRIDAKQLVPGDIVLLASGDKIPADLRLLRSRRLQIDESALTGEPLPVKKSVNVVDFDSILANRSNMGYSSTVVSYGIARGVVTATGDHTEIGRMIASAKRLATPLARKIARFSHLLLYVILGLAVLTFLIGL